MADRNGEYMQLKTNYTLLEIKENETASKANQAQALLDCQKCIEEDLVTK